jgi:hypothetical protein
MIKLCSALVVFALLSPMMAHADEAEADKSAYTLFNPVPADQLRDFSPDRPTKSNGATTVDAGHFQYEGDFVSWSYDRYNASSTTTSNFIVADPTFKLGLTANTDLELTLAPINVNASKDRVANAKSSAFGFGDVVTRLKYNLVGNDGGGIALAIVPYVKAPTATAAIGNRHWEGGAYAPLSISLPENWGLNFQTEMDALERGDLTGTYLNYQNLVNVSHPLFFDNLTGYVELWSNIANDAQTPPQCTTDLSLAWAIKDNLQLDVGVNLGLNKAAPDMQSYMGIAQRF